jgi:Trk K+ transport system NAD-binding subunit
METANHVILFGSGHLVFQVGRRLHDQNVAVTHISSERFQVASKPLRESLIEHFRNALQEAGIQNARAVYVLDEEDRYNIQFALIAISLNDSVPIIVSLFNAELAGHLQDCRSGIIVLNPAQVATNLFVEALRAPLMRRIRRHGSGQPLFPKMSEIRSNPWLYLLVLMFVFLLGGGTVLFHFTEKLSWLDAAYFTVTVMTTTGFGDITLRNSSGAVKIFGICLMLGAVVLASLTFSFITDRLLKKRSEMALGRKRYRLSDHVIVCGLGKSGYQVASELLKRKEKILVIEKDADNRFLESIRSQGARIFVGDASLSTVLNDAGVYKACGLFSMINDDLKNLEIGLNARSLRPDLRLILRVFDKEIAEQLRDRLDIHFAMSTSAIAAEEFVMLLDKCPVERLSGTDV